jgi:hypothetical protein
MYLPAYETRERYKLYNVLGAEAGIADPVRVVSTPWNTTDAFLPDGARVDGEAIWEGDHYAVRLSTRLSPAEELRTLAHELGHIRCGHVPRVLLSAEARARRDRVAGQVYQGIGSAEALKAWRVREEDAERWAQAYLQAWHDEWGICWE